MRLTESHAIKIGRGEGLKYSLILPDIALITSALFNESTTVIGDFVKKCGGIKKL